MQKKQFDKKKYVAVFLLTTIIFVCGLLVGTLTSTNKLGDVRELQDTLRSDTLDLEVLYTLVAQNPCVYTNTSVLEEQLFEISLKLDYMESLLGETNSEVLRLKKYYSLLELRQWMFEQRAEEQCGVKKDIILYFYDNRENACDSCEAQGFVLSYLRKKFDTHLSVYSFDYTIESQAVRATIERFNITQVPSIVLNGETLVGFQSRETLESIFAQEEQDAFQSEEMKEIKALMNE